MKCCTYCHGEGSYLESARVPIYASSGTRQNMDSMFQEDVRTVIGSERVEYSVICDKCGGTGYVPEHIDKNYTLD